MSDILLCSDLDRTILPNGSQPQSPEASQILAHLARKPEITLVYVSGRHKSLLQQALEEYGIPLPDYAIGDVGTTIYDPQRKWRPWDDWAEEISRDWQGRTAYDLQPLFSDMGELRLQEAEKQNTFKLSYYSDATEEATGLPEKMQDRLAAKGIQASVIWSIDEEKDVGLLDILPERATKVHAINFLMDKKGFAAEQCVFAGDSGNDLPALTSGLNAVLVKNASGAVKEEAIREITRKKLQQHLYLAQGDFLGMNGNYCAGVLEGVAHFFPGTSAWMREAINDIL